jgi:hypothetical protein
MFVVLVIAVVVVNGDDHTAVGDGDKWGKGKKFGGDCDDNDDSDFDGEAGEC